MAYYSKYTGKELEERLDRINDIPALIDKLFLNKEYLTELEVKCLIKEMIPLFYKDIPIDNKTIYWDNGVLKSVCTGEGNNEEEEEEDYQCLWELREHNGQQYIYSKLPVVTQYGITIYGNNGDIDLPSLYAGLPIDGQTIYWDKGVLKSLGGGGEGLDEEALRNYLLINGYVTRDELPSLNGYATESWVLNLGYIGPEGLKNYVDISSNQDINGKKNFKSGISINGLDIYQSQDDVIYIDANIVVRGGITMFSDRGDVDIPSIAQGLPFDNRTIWYNPSTNKIEVIGGTGGGVSNFWDLNNIPSWITMSKPKYTYSEIEGTPDLSVYAKNSDVTTLSGKLNDFLEGSDTDNIINKWKELESFLSGLSESDNLATILLTKADKTYVDDTFVTLATSQTITGEKNFTGGIKVNGSPIYYDSTKKYWKLEGDLLVTGGVTMYGSDSEFTPSTIMDAIKTDGVTIRVNPTTKNLEVIGNTSGATTLGGLSNVGTWADSVADVDRIMYQAAGSSNWVSKNLSDLELKGDYLPLSGGTLSGNLVLKSSTTSGATPKLYFQRGTVSDDYHDSYAYNQGGNFTIGIAYNGSSYDVVKFGKERMLPTKDNSYIIGAASYRMSDVNTVLLNGYTPITSNNISEYAVLASTYTASDVLSKLLTVDGSGSGLDADLLDGLDSSFYGQFLDGSNIDLNASRAGFRAGKLYSASNAVNYAARNRGFLEYGTTDYRAQFNSDKFNLYYRWLENKVWGDWKTIAFTDSNVASATKLETPRTIWGQSFDGSANVTGDLAVGDGNIYLSNDKRIKAYTTSGSSVSLLRMSPANNCGIGSTKYNTYIDGTNLYFRYGNGTTGITLNSSGNVLIGTDTDSGYKLDVNGTIGLSGGLTLTGTAADNAIIRFSRSSYNYISAPSNGIIAIQPNGMGLNSRVGYKFSGTTFFPSATDTYTLGATDNRWKNTYSVLGDFSGDVTFGTKITINGIPISKSQDDVLYIDGNLVVRGGITMYGTNTTSVPSILDSLPIASTTTKGIASFDSNFFSVGSDGKVTFIGQTGGGVADSVAWSGITGKPTTLSGYGITDAVGYVASIIANNADGYKWIGYGRTEGGFPINGGAIKVGINNYQMILHGRNDVLRFNTVEAGTLQTWRKVWHDGNFTPSDYLPLTGGTLKGTLQIQLDANGHWGLEFTNGHGAIGSSGTNHYVFPQLGTSYIRSGNTDLYHRKNGNDHKIWDASNDGEGSGLDADLLDGVHLSNIVRYADRNDNGTQAATAQTITYWGDGHTSHGYTYGTSLNLQGAGSWNHRLDFRTDGWLDYYQGINTNSMSYIGTIAFVSSNVASATKLQTARTIWGHGFNGESGITGTVHTMTGHGIHLAVTDETGWNNRNILATSWTASTADYTEILVPSSTSNDAFLRLLHNGNVGIGTAIPSYKLDINGEFRCVSAIRIQPHNEGWADVFFNYSSTKGYLLSARGGETNKNLRLYNYTNSTYNPLIDVTESGNVYIGTTTGIGHSTARLQSYNTENEWASLCYTDNSAIFSAHQSGYGAIITSKSNNSGKYLLNIRYNDNNLTGAGSPALAVFDNGNVGIGTANPEYKLHVFGDMRSYSLHTDMVRTVQGIAFLGIGSGTYNIGTIRTNSNYGLEIEAAKSIDSNGGTMLPIFFGWRGGNQGMLLSSGGNLLVNGGVTMYSDQRKKTILNNVELSLKQIANAPLIEHYYNSDINKTTHVGSIAQYWASMNDWFCKLDSEGFYTMEIQNCALASAISIARELDRYESKTDKTIKQLKKRICQLEEEVERLRAS